MARYRSRIDPALAAIVAEGFLSRLSFGIIGFALPLYAYRLGMSLSAIGVLVALNVIVEMLLKPAMGPGADRFGLKRSFTVAMGARSLVALLLGFAGAPWQLYGIRALHGASESLRDPSVNALIAERGGKNAVASAFAWYGTARMVAGAIGKAAAGILLTLTVSDFRLVFLVAFLLSALPIYVVARYVPGGTEDVSPFAASRPRMEPATGLAGAQKGRPAILPFVGFGVLINGTAAMVNNLFPILATKYAGLTEAEAGIVYAGSTLVILFAGPMFGWLSDNVSRKSVLLVRGIANTLSSLIYLVAPTFAGVAAAKIVDDTGKAAFRPAWGALMAHLSGFDRANRARVMGYLGLGENIGESAGPLMAGLIWSAWGVPAVLVIRAGLSVLTEIYAILLARTSERAGTAEAVAGVPAGTKK